MPLPAERPDIILIKPGGGDSSHVSLRSLLEPDGRHDRNRRDGVRASCSNAARKHDAITACENFPNSLNEMGQEIEILAHAFAARHIMTCAARRNWLDVKRLRGLHINCAALSWMQPCIFTI
jgi:hypothetical protein